ncbi:eukaryotic translation initiation factor 1-like [Cynocephalus volans]|uniref:eukaryotic translation initiation factor 1-like n=1 Tax=Cynocephalus volans TaxID=110931 RepID=UPI002FCA84A6
MEQDPHPQPLTPPAPRDLSRNPRLGARDQTQLSHPGTLPMPWGPPRSLGLAAGDQTPSRKQAHCDSASGSQTQAPSPTLSAFPCHCLPLAISMEEKELYHLSVIQNFHSFGPFADARKGDDLLPVGTEDYIHIRIQQRNGRKTLTTVQGIADDNNKKKLVKEFKKKSVCHGTVIEHPEYGEVIQLQSNQRKNIHQFLKETGLAKDDQLKVHGLYAL